MKKLLLCVPVFLLLCSCGSEDRDREIERLGALATEFCNELTFPQQLRALLIVAHNDTAKVCKALVMSRQTFIRLSKEDTCPTSFAVDKVVELYVNSVMTNAEYMDTMSENDEDQKDWLMHNSINEPVNPVWEQVCGGRKWVRR